MCVPYLFELGHPVLRPNFEQVPFFKKSKDQYLSVLLLVTMILHIKRS